MGLRSELLALAEQACEEFSVAPVSRIFMPEPTPSPERDSEFGIVALEDGAAGLYYAWMGDSQKGMNRRHRVEDYLGHSPAKLLQLYSREHEADRSLGMAALNAISQSVFQQAGMKLPDAGDSMGELDVQEGDHVGMVGYFPSLVRRLLAAGIKVTVIEKKTHLLKQEHNLVMSPDPAALEGCSRVLCTASTLLNDTIDEILAHCGDAGVINIIGPTAGFIPDPLFQAGVSAIGGSQLVDVNLAIERVSHKQGLGSAARKYLLKREDYCGYSGLARL